MESVGDKSMVPQEEERLAYRVSYREWLIGQVAGGIVSRGSYVSHSDAATSIIDIADTIIARLDAEHN